MSEDAVFVIGADGQNLHQVTETTSSSSPISIGHQTAEILFSLATFMVPWIFSQSTQTVQTSDG